MAKSIIKRKKSNILIIALLSPILMVIFIAGWCLAWIGESKQQKTKQPLNTINRIPEKEELEIVFVPHQEQQIQRTSNY